MCVRNPLTSESLDRLISAVSDPESPCGYISPMAAARLACIHAETLDTWRRLGRRDMTHNAQSLYADLEMVMLRAEGAIQAYAEKRLLGSRAWQATAKILDQMNPVDTDKAAEERVLKTLLDRLAVGLGEGEFEHVFGLLTEETGAGAPGGETAESVDSGPGPHRLLQEHAGDHSVE